MTYAVIIADTNEWYFESSNLADAKASLKQARRHGRKALLVKILIAEDEPLAPEMFDE